MTPKLVRRAAQKYRQWMVEASQEFGCSSKETMLERASLMAVKVDELNRWLKRFYYGIAPRFQEFRDRHGNVEYHKAVGSPDVYVNIGCKMVPDISTDISNQAATISSLVKAAAGGTPIVPISLVAAMDEINAIVDEWPEVKYKNDILSVKIDDVSVSDENEEVDLGSFWMHLNLTDPLETLRIESIDEIRSEGGYCHPHVSGSKLCKGDGVDLSIDALRQGRLEDYFRVIEAVLRTYNGGSPHEELRQWYDPSHEDQSLCNGCDDWYHNDYMIWCEMCQESYCENCANGGGECSGCHKYVCGHCSSSCSDCGNTVCDNCKLTCDCCGEAVCQECCRSCADCSNTMCESCSTSCSYCGDSVCENHSVECEICHDPHCSNCVGETCNNCNKSICLSCRDECPDCGVPMCSSCLEEHECLLSEVES